MDDDKLRQAVSLYKQGNKSQAAILLGEIVRQDPNNSNAWYGLALSLDEPDRKIFCLKKVVALEPSHQKAQQLLEKLQSEQKPSPSPRFREPLFWLAWLLLLICMFLPQGGIGARSLSVPATIVYGLGLAVLAITAGLILEIFLPLLMVLSNPLMLLTNPFLIFTIFAFPLASLTLAVSMSDLLFIASPFILRWSRSSPKKMRTAWLIYASLNLICVILFLWTILKMPIVGHIDPLNGGTQALPGLLVWVGAQITLTVAAFTKLKSSGA